ncbi:MAG: N-acetylmuramoyl-L-alanine amidase family protein [Anaerolineae bacterium]
MKKASTVKKSRRAANVQRAAVQRSQRTGRRQAAQSSRRLSPAQAGSGSHKIATSRLTYDVSSPESVELPFAVRRAVVAFIVLVALALISVVVAQNWEGFVALQSAGRTGASETESAAILPAPNAGAVRIGIVSGHRGNDSGAVCTDGLTEAQVNFDHAVRVASLLRAQGYMVDILDEFDPRLQGYVADALVSIHADSCAYINDLATGFKVTRARESRLPEAEDRLVACLTERYQQATSLRFHANTVTYDMTQYHAFYEIAPTTPAAIIETGFLYLDRPVLTRKADRVAQGIVDGILCYLAARDDR